MNENKPSAGPAKKHLLKCIELVLVLDQAYLSERGEGEHMIRVHARLAVT